MAVEAELRAQIETAYAAGIDVTHLDSHMGTVWQPEFLDDLRPSSGASTACRSGLRAIWREWARTQAQLQAAFDELIPLGHPDC